MRSSLSSCRIYGVNQPVSELYKIFKKYKDKNIKVGTTTKSNNTYNFYFKIIKITKETKWYKLDFQYTHLISYDFKGKTKYQSTIPSGVLYIPLKKPFSDFIFLHGNTSADKRILNGLGKILQKEDIHIDVFRRVLVDFIDHENLIKAFPNFQKFCVRGIKDRSIDDIIVKGRNLQKIKLYQIYLKSKKAGTLNVIGIIYGTHMIYLTKYGNFYSRNKFDKVDFIKIVMAMVEKIHKHKAFVTSLDVFFS